MNVQSNEGPAPVYVVASPGPYMPPSPGTQPASDPQNMASQQSRLQKFPFDVLKSISIEVTLVLSILVTLLGFLPTGIVAVVFSLLSLSEFKNGNMAKAKEYCNIAQIWIVITVIVCILLWITIVLMFIFTFLFFKENDSPHISMMINSETFELFSITLFFLLTVFYIFQARMALQQGDTAEVKMTLNRILFLTSLYLIYYLENWLEVLLPCPFHGPNNAKGETAAPSNV